ncbi:hypothetical protein ASF44_08035 [Pseudorhodoferax sp. Leaf274]|nr:hypothetical protein ASF44_08035 [Pseudorhodoferax sp. Leaf274]
MRITMTQARLGEAGAVLALGQTYTVSDAFGAEMVGKRFASDTDGVLLPPQTANPVSSDPQRGLVVGSGSSVSGGGGTPIVVTGTPGVGNVLTASFPMGTGAVKWQRLIGSTWTDIAGETALTYTQVVADAPGVRPVATAYTPFGAATTFPGPSVYLGNFAGQVLTMTDRAGSGSGTQSMSRSRHRARAAVSFVQIAIPNWVVLHSNFTETAGNGPATVEAAIEYPIGTTSTRFKWSTANSTVIPAGETSALSDKLAIALPKNAEFMIRIYWTCPNGLIWQSSPSGGFYPLVNDTARGEGYVYAVSGLANTVTGVGAVSGGTSGGDGIRFGPCAIVSDIVEPTIGIIGDSRTTGASDSYGDATGDLGVVARSIGPNFGYIHVGKHSDGADKFIASSTRRRELMQYVSHIICEYGINDVVGAGRTWTQLQASLNTIHGYFPDKPVWQTTLNPWTTSSDSWATTAGQTKGAWATRYDEVNAGIRAGGVGAGRVFDIASIAESAIGSGLWRVNGTANYATNDGAHETFAMNILIKNSGIIPASAFTR